MVLRGSHKQGLYRVHDAQGAGGMGIDTDKLEYGWQTIDYKVGDLLLFHSHTVHKALPNVSGDQIRISADYRYSALSKPIVPDGLEPHFGRLTWDEIYEGWQDRICRTTGNGCLCGPLRATRGSKRWP